MARPNPNVVALLEAWLAAAKRGDLTDIVIVARRADFDYVRGFDVERKNIDDMLLELRTAVIWLQMGEKSRAHDGA